MCTHKYFIVQAKTSISSIKCHEDPLPSLTEQLRCGRLSHRSVRATEQHKSFKQYFKWMCFDDDKIKYDSIYPCKNSRHWIFKANYFFFSRKWQCEYLEQLQYWHLLCDICSMYKFHCALECVTTQQRLHSLKKWGVQSRLAHLLSHIHYCGNGHFSTYYWDLLFWKKIKFKDQMSWITYTVQRKYIFGGFHTILNHCLFYTK